MVDVQKWKEKAKDFQGRKGGEKLNSSLGWTLFHVSAQRAVSAVVTSRGEQKGRTLSTGIPRPGQFLCPKNVIK